MSVLENQFPLVWPGHLPRAKARQWSKFKVSGAVAWQELINEVERFGGEFIVISSNAMRRRDGNPYADALIDELVDPGVAVYFTKNDRRVCMPCDQFMTVRENVRAIGNSIAAMREIERNGSSVIFEAAFAGFAALPPPSGPRWYEVLGVSPNASKGEISMARKRLAREHGADSERMGAVNAAHDEGMATHK